MHTQDKHQGIANITKYQDHSTKSEAMNQNMEVNGETKQSSKFMEHERKQWKQAKNNTAKLQDSVLQSFNVEQYC
jgi:hypothetical protein